MIEKPKRPKKIHNQDNKQPQTIAELIRRYDLDNIKIYDFIDKLVEQLNANTVQNNEKINKIDSKVTGTIIYENETGISEGSFDLEDDITHYKKLDFYDINGNFVGRCLPSANVVYLSYMNQGSGTLYIVSARLTINKNTVTFYSNYRSMFNGTEWTMDTGYLITIGQIVGYKEV